MNAGYDRAHAAGFLAGLTAAEQIMSEQVAQARAEERAEVLIKLTEWAYQYKRDPEARRTLDWVMDNLSKHWVALAEPAADGVLWRCRYCNLTIDHDPPQGDRWDHWCGITKQIERMERVDDRAG